MSRLNANYRLVCRDCFSYLFVLTMFIPLRADAYIGPGVGLTAIGTFVALVLIVILALVGFVWYPAKRAWKRRKAQKSIDNE